MEFQFQHQSFQWISRTYFLWMDWLDLLAVQGTLKSLLQHRSSKASILQGSAFFTVQLLHPYMTNGKTIPLTRWTFVDKVSLLFNMLSRFVIASFPRSKHLLMSWLQSPSAVTVVPKMSLLPLFPHLFVIKRWKECQDLRILMLSFKPAFSLSSFTLIKRLYSSSSLSTIRVISSAYLRLLIFLPAVFFLNIFFLEG